MCNAFTAFTCVLRCFTACLCFITACFCLLPHVSFTTPFYASVDNNTAPTPLKHRFYTAKLPESTFYLLPVHHPYTPTPGYTLYTTAPGMASGAAPGAGYAENGAPAMDLRLILISRERTQVLTVKSVCGLDAVLEDWSYSSTLTNKEETLLTFPYELSATVSMGSSLMPFLMGYAPL